MTHPVVSGNHHVPFDASISPVLSIDSGDDVTFQTLDACWNEVRSIEDFHRYRGENRRGSNPLTGPVFVRGAKPGGTLCVEIRTIELDPIGFQLIGPQRAMIRDEIAQWKCHLVRIDGQTLRLDNGISLPVDPVIGELGNAPRNQVTNAPNPCGGNLDCPFVRGGAIVYLPIEVEGALFSCGDVHARQGDGEIVGAPEIGARVTLRLSCIDRKLNDWPLIEDADCWHAIGSAASEADAVRLAVFQAAKFLGRRREMPLDDAMILLTMIAKIHCCRSGAWGSHGPVVAVSMPKALLPSAQLSSADIPPAGAIMG